SSFRKERSNPLHLAEFHHIEYEGKIGQEQMESVAIGLLAAVARRCIATCEADLALFLTAQDINALADFSERPRAQFIDLQDALDALHRDTKDDRFKRFTLEGTLGSAEETRLTEIYGGLVALRKFPLMEVPFYHAHVPNSSPKTARNTDLIWPGYNEIIGSG